MAFYFGVSFTKSETKNATITTNIVFYWFIYNLYLCRYIFFFFIKNKNSSIFHGYKIYSRFMLLRRFKRMANVEIKFTEIGVYKTHTHTLTLDRAMHCLGIRYCVCVCVRVRVPKSCCAC